MSLGIPHLDLLYGVDDKHVLKVFHGALHPVVEGRGPLGVLQVELVDGFKLLLRFLGGRYIPAGVGGKSSLMTHGDPLPPSFPPPPMSGSNGRGV